MNNTLSPGAELKRSSIPEKYCKKSSLIGDLLPSAVCFLLVEIYSCYLMHESFGIISFIIGFITYIAFMTFLYFMFSKTKKEFAKTYISVCENVICRIYMGTRIRAKEYCIPYSDIIKVTAKKESLRIVTKTNGSIFHYLSDAREIESLIQSKLG